MANNPSTNLLEVPHDLFEKVMLRLDAEQRLKLARHRFITSAVFLVVGVLVAIPTWRSFQLNLAQSGFTDYLSLGFQDFHLVTGMWQDFTLSLLESLPIVSSIELLAVIFYVLYSLKRATVHSRALFAPTQYLPHTT